MKTIQMSINKWMGKWGNSLVVQWLGIGTLTAGAQVPSLAKELKSYTPLGEAKKQTNTNNNNKKPKQMNE